MTSEEAAQSIPCGHFRESGYEVTGQERIERVEKYERMFEEAAASHDPEKLRLLEAYYTSGAWREDYEADERGELPPDLKRGVLSQDALYDLLEELDK